MEQEILHDMKQDYSDMLKISQGDYSEIEKLKEDSAVKRYLYLMKLKQDPYMAEHGNWSLVGNVMSKYGYGAIKESNDIWVYMWESKASRFKDVTFIGFDGPIDENQMAVLYQDLEIGNRMIVVNKAKQEEFERTHKIVRRDPNIIDPGDGYYNRKYHFFDDCIKEGQEIAIQRVLFQRKDNK